MTVAAQIAVFVIAFLGLGLVVWLVRRGSLKERFALIWLAVGIGMVVLALIRPLLDRLSDSLGITSGTTTLFIMAILFLLGLVLHLSVIVSRLEEKVRDIAEAHALAVAEWQDASTRSEAPVGGSDDGKDQA